jgi:hypothetical protein
MTKGSKQDGRLKVSQTAVAHFVRTPDDLRMILDSIPYKTLQQIKPRDKHFPHEHLSKRILHSAAKSSSFTEALIKTWLSGNSQLMGQVADLISPVEPNQLENGIIEILSRQAGGGKDDHEALLCALLLDPRDELREAVTSELRQAVLDPEGEWRKRAGQRWQQRRIEKVEREKDDLQEQLQALRGSMGIHSKELEGLRASLTRTEHAKEQLEEEQNLLKLQLIEREKQLKQAHEQSEMQTRHQERWQNQVSEMQRKITHLEHDKQGVVAEREAALLELERLRQERDRLQAGLEYEQWRVRHTVSLHDMDGSWRQALEVLKQKLGALAADDGLAPGGAVSTQEARVNATERAQDWEMWQEKEQQLVCGLLSTPSDSSLTSFSTEQRSQAARDAQKLLALRWYLLEGLRLQLAGSLIAQNHWNLPALHETEQHDVSAQQVNDLASTVQGGAS